MSNTPPEDQKELKAGNPGLSMYPVQKRKLKSLAEKLSARLGRRVTPSDIVQRFTDRLTLRDVEQLYSHEYDKP